MATTYVWFLLGLFSCVNSYMLAEQYYGNYLLQYWGGGEDRMSWCQAEQACRMIRGDLAMPKTSGFNDAIVDLVRYTSSPRVWIGGSDMFKEQNWRWIDGSWFTSGYTNWRVGEPNESGDGEDCVELFNIGLWNDAACDEKLEYVCQIDTTKTTKSDFAVLVFSDSYSVGSKIATSIDDARIECKNRGLKLILDIDSIPAVDQIHEHMLKFTGAKYCIDDENQGRMMSINGILDQDCADQLFLYICEGYRPHHLKISDEAPVVEESGSVEIECNADGYPIPDVVWHKNYDHVITTDTNMSIHQKMSPGKSTLVIKNAKQGDVNRYRCFATNNINGEEHSTSINADFKVNMNPK